MVNRFPWNGVAIGGSEATGNVIAGNCIGTDSSGSWAQGNGFNGVFIGLDAHHNTVGRDNYIAYNGDDGVAVDTLTATGNILVSYIGL